MRRECDTAAARGSERWAAGDAGNVPGSARARWCRRQPRCRVERAAEQGDQLARQREADAEPAETPGKGAVDLAEIVEDDRQVVRRDADAGVGDRISTIPSTRSRARMRISPRP
jgi:hypothetical protein